MLSINCIMKLVLTIAAVLLLSGVARADWKDLKPGMDQQAAFAAAGVPMMQNRGKAGAEVWTYDRSGCIQFSYGRVTCWEQPKPQTAKPAPAAVVKSEKPSKAAPAPTKVVKTTRAIPANLVAAE